MECPACAEMIPDDLRICPACQTDMADFAQQRPEKRQTGGVSRRGRSSQPVRLLILLGGLGMGIGLLMGLAVLVGWFGPQIEMARYQSQRASEQKGCQQNLGRIARALQAYHDTCGSFPPAVTWNSAGQPMHSWRVLILPFLEGAPQDLDYRLDEPWESPHNRRVTATTPEVFRCPGNPNGATFGTTHYLAIDGPHAVLNSEHPSRLPEIVDGAGSTLMIVEGRDPSVHWAEPRDLEIGRGTGFGPDGMSSNHEDGFHAAFADGTVRKIDYRIGPQGLLGLSTIDGGEVVEGF